MSKQYDLIVFIGRCEPNHIGHNKIIRKATEMSNSVLVLLGSANRPRSIKNPFTFEERKKFIQRIFGSAKVEGIIDYDYQDTLWTEQVYQAVDNNLKDRGLNPRDAKIAVLGHEKDESSYYLQLFPTWKFLDFGKFTGDGNQLIDATKIRELYFEGHLEYLRGVLDRTTYNEMSAFMITKEYKQLVKEYEFIKKYKEQWADSPYPPTFMTVDAIVIQGSHVLLIKRKSEPGKGLWAMPGGFIQPYEVCKDAMLRELKEETKLKVPTPILEKSIVHQQLFDDPGRSTRGRTFTQAFLIHLTGGNGELPKVKGADDAEEARWVPLHEFENMSAEMYEDHYSIVHLMKGFIN
jgi:bifunctional NMN adenylyltransferase/nudix hydrolase